MSRPGLRISEAKTLGFSRCLLSRSNLEGTVSSSGMDLVGVETVQDLHDLLFA